MSSEDLSLIRAVEAQHFESGAEAAAAKRLLLKHTILTLLGKV